MNQSKIAMAWIAGFGGAGLLFAAIKGKGPVASVAAALQGDTTPGSALQLATPVPGVITTPGTDAPASGVSTAESGGPVPVSATAVFPCGNGKTVRLIPTAGAAFVRWVAAFGAPIPADGYRSVAQQQIGYGQDSTRFGSPQTSWHTAGKAVDVDLGGMSAATQSKLRTTAKANGWLQARWQGEASCGTNTTNDNEPWHFSYGGCG